MNKLLSANFLRLRKSKTFWACMAVMFAVGVCFPILRSTGEISTDLEYLLFACSVFIGIVISVFCSLFVGTEYSDGTIRNKIIVGQKRWAIYLSIMIICSIAGIALCLAYFVPYLCIGIPTMGYFTVSMKVVLLFASAVFTLSIAYSAIFTMIAMLNQNKAIVTAVCILCAFLLFFSAGMIQQRLSEPKMIEPYSYQVSGEMTTAEAIPNPNYIKGVQRDIYEFLNDFSPGGQGMQLANMTGEKPGLLCLYSIIIIIGTTGAGLLLFRRKDLK